MRLRRSAASGPLACVLLSTVILTGTGFVGGAHADPVSGVAVAPAQAALVTAQQELARTEAAAQQAEGLYTEAIARERAAQQAATSAAQHAQASATLAATAKIELGRLVAAAYRSGAALDLSSLTMVLDVKDPLGYMNGVRVVKRLLASQSSIVTQSEDASRDASAARIQAEADAASVRAAEASVAQSAKDAEKAQAAAQAQVTVLGAQLDELLAKKAAAEVAADAAGGGGADVGVEPNASGIAAQVIAYAMAQIGKPYLWGGTGPDAFDCSGLAMRAYESAGIDLPHFAAFQYQASHPLAYSQLRPGDLMFWATKAGDSNTIYHEAIYLGGQKMVQAPKTGWDVMVSDMWMWGPIQFYARPAVGNRN